MKKIGKTTWKKLIVSVMVFILTMMILAGCGTGKGSEPAQAEPEAKEEIAAEEKEVEKPVEQPVAETAPEEEEKTATPEEEEETAAPEGEERELTETELKKIEEDLNTSAYNGFVVAEFASPKEIFWDEALYNGGGTDISEQETKKIEEAFLKITGDDELFCPVTAVRKTDLEDIVKKTTGLTYDVMEHPLTWMYLKDQDVYAFCHGDTNFMPVKLLSGSRKGNELSIDYKFAGFDGEDNTNDTDAVIFNLKMTESPDGYVFISNLWNPPEGREAGIQKIYDEIIQKYARAVKEGWDMEKLQDNNMSYLCGLFANTRGADYDPMENMGYYYRDLDKDGIGELFIGANSNDEWIETVFEVYSVRAGDWTRILSAGERDEYFLADDDTFYNQGSDSAFSYALLHYKVEGSYKFLTPIDGIIYEERTGETAKGPWYYTKDGYWNTENAEPISEKEYSDYENKAQASYVRIEYTPFSTVELTDASPAEEEKDQEQAKVENSGEGYTDDEICKMALDYYEKENNYRPSLAAIDSSNGDMVTIQLYDNMGDHNSTSAWYEIDRKTGKGTDTVFGTEISLW